MASKCLELETEKADFSELYEVIEGKNASLMFDEGIVNKGILAGGQGIGLPPTSRP